MEKKVKAYIEENRIILPGDKIILGLSGGADSVCLFFLMLALRSELDFEFACVHVHHGLRGREADEDEAYVQQLCREHQIFCRTFFYQVKQEAEQRGCSEEEMGRILRYRSFEEVLKELHYNKIAVAHHMADQAETVIYHLCRGSGLSGLSGMRPVSGNRIRPLLCLKKEEITAYLTERQIAWREDYTNAELVYTRNRIRAKVLPCLQENINPASTEHIADCAKLLWETEQYIRRQAEDSWKRCAEESEQELRFLLSEYGRQDIVIQKQLIFMAVDFLKCGRKDIQSVHLSMVLGLIGAQAGSEVCLPGGIRAVREYQTICLSCKKEKEEKREALIFPPKMCGEYELPDKSGIIVLSAPIPANQIPEKEIHKNEENSYTKWFDYDRIKDNLQLRTRMEGDYLELSEAGFHKKLKSYLIDAKVPRQQRDQIWLLADGSHILWIVGYRISEGYKIRKDTRQAVRVEIKWR